MKIHCPHGKTGWCDQCAQTSKQAKEANLASNMTTRQAFAMAAMQGMASNSGTPIMDYDHLAGHALEMANAMLKALEES